MAASPSVKVNVGERGVCVSVCNREHAATCLAAIDCGEPPKVANGELKESGELAYTYQSVVRYRCQVGMLMGSSEVWCRQDGTWSTPPTCEGVHQ